MLKASLIGNVGSVDFKYLQSGKAVLNISVAANQGYGENKTTEWVRCAVFGERAEKLKDFVTKGGKVYIEGDLSKREYEGKNGHGVSLEVVVSTLELLGSKGERDAVETVPGNVSVDIPF